MKKALSRFSTIALIGSVFALPGCGGGGGGGDDTAGEVPASSTITLANSTNVAAQSLAASSSLSGQVDGVAGTAGLVTGVSVSLDGDKTPLIDASIAQLYRALQAKPSSVVVGVSGSETVSCSGGGTATVSFNVADPDVVSNGDSVSISASNCVEDGMRMNGGLSLTFSNITGTPSASSSWSATLAITFRNFSVVDGSVTDSANGDLRLGYSQGASGYSYSATGNSLAVSTTRGGSTVTRTISNYSDSGTVNASGISHGADFTISGNLPNLGSNVRYTVDTVVNFQQQEGSNPHAGQLTVKATDNTGMRLTVIDTSNVRIELDKNADGTYEETVNKTWADIYALM